MASHTLAEGLTLALCTPSTALAHGHARAQVAAETLHEALTDTHADLRALCSTVQAMRAAGDVEKVMHQK